MSDSPLLYTCGCGFATECDVEADYHGEKCFAKAVLDDEVVSKLHDSEVVRQCEMTLHGRGVLVDDDADPEYGNDEDDDSDYQFDDFDYNLTELMAKNLKKKMCFDQLGIEGVAGGRVYWHSGTKINYESRPNDIGQVTEKSLDVYSYGNSFYTPKVWTVDPVDFNRRMCMAREVYKCDLHGVGNLYSVEFVCGDGNLWTAKCTEVSVIIADDKRLYTTCVPTELMEGDALLECLRRNVEVWPKQLVDVFMPDCGHVRKLFFIGGYCDTELI